MKRMRLIGLALGVPGGLLAVNGAGAAVSHECGEGSDL